MKSWKTNLFGAIGVAAGCVVAADFGPVATKIAGCVASIGTALGLFFARDNNVTSEQVGADPASKAIKAFTNSAPPIGLWLLFWAGLCLFVSGCGTTAPQRVQSVADTVEILAYNASEALLIEKPAAEPGLRAAATELRRLETLEHVDMNSIMAVVSKFPAQQMKSPYARLAVNNGTLLLTRFGSQLTQTDIATLDLKPIVTSLRQGIELRIGAPQ